MRRPLIATLLLCACEPYPVDFDEAELTSGEGWADEPYETWDTGAEPVTDGIPWDQATFRIDAPKSATVLPLGEVHHFEASLTGPDGEPLPLDDVEVLWSSALDTSWLGMGASFDDDALDIGVHTLTAQATMPDGTVMSHTIGAVLVQSAYAGTYAGLYSVDVIVLGATLPCTGATTIVVEATGETGYGEGACLLSIPLLGGDITFNWVFEPEIDAYGNVTGTVGLSALGLFTVDFDAAGVLDPEGVGFDVTWAGAIPFVGDVDGYLDAPRVSIQSF